MWDVSTGTLLRSFDVTQPASETPAEWPLFKWSHDGSYIAKMVAGAQGSISVYETPSMALLDKKSIKVFRQSHKGGKLG